MKSTPIRAQASRPAGGSSVQETATASRRRAALRLVVSVIGLAALGSIVLLRQSGRPATDTVFAEDAGVFLHDAWQMPGMGPVLEPYAGYMHLVPRMLALLVALLPPTWAAAALAILSTVVLVLLTAFVYWVSADLLPTRAVRLVLAASLPLLPVALLEGLHSATNLHWFLLYGCFWALVATPTSPARASCQALVAGVTVLSDPLAALFAPLLLLQLRRGRAGASIIIVYCAGLLVQIAVALTDERSANESPPSGDLVRAYAARVLLSGYLGVDGALDAFDAWGSLTLVCALVMTSAVVLLGVGKDRLGALQLLALGYSAGLFVACFAYNWGPGIAPGTTANLVGSSRYSIAPTLLLLTALAVAVQRQLEAIHVDSPPWAVARTYAVTSVAGLLVLFGFVNDFRMDNARASGPSWGAELAAAQAHCARFGGEATLSSASPGFVVRVQCEHLKTFSWRDPQEPPKPLPATRPSPS